MSQGITYVPLYDTLGTLHGYIRPIFLQEFFLKSGLSFFIFMTYENLIRGLNLDETGVNAVEFIVNHAEVSLVFVQEKTVSSVSPFFN